MQSKELEDRRSINLTINWFYGSCVQRYTNFIFIEEPINLIIDRFSDLFNWKVN
jgi:hypothetical protein